ADADPAVRENPGAASLKCLFGYRAHGDLGEVLDFGTPAIGVENVERPDVFGVDDRKRKLAAARQDEAVSCMDIRDLKIDVLHGSDLLRGHRTGVDHELDNVAA